MDYIKKKIQEKIEGLIISKNKEEASWGQLLNAVFNDDNNIILSDGNEIVLLWGWQFKNKISKSKIIHHEIS